MATIRIVLHSSNRVMTVSVTRQKAHSLSFRLADSFNPVFLNLSARILHGLAEFTSPSNIDTVQFLLIPLYVLINLLLALRGSNRSSFEEFQVKETIGSNYCVLESAVTALRGPLRGRRSVAFLLLASENNTFICSQRRGSSQVFYSR